MAYVSKEKKTKIAAAVKAVMPKDWKYTLSRPWKGTIALTIWSAPIDLLEMTGARQAGLQDVQLNNHHLDKEFSDQPEIQEIFKKLNAALNTDNYDRSDIQSDYFDVGHYVDINLGKSGKPFIVIEKE